MEIFPHFTVFVFAIIVFYVSYKAFVFWTFCKWSVLRERFANFIVLHYASSMLILTSKSSIFFNIFYISYDIIITAYSGAQYAGSIFKVCMVILQ